MLSYKIRVEIHYNAPLTKLNWSIGHRINRRATWTQQKGNLDRGNASERQFQDLPAGRPSSDLIFDGLEVMADRVEIDMHVNTRWLRLAHDGRVLSGVGEIAHGACTAFRWGWCSSHA
jgi:hypothetical protein